MKEPAKGSPKRRSRSPADQQWKDETDDTSHSSLTANPLSCGHPSASSLGMGGRIGLPVHLYRKEAGDMYHWMLFLNGALTRQLRI